MNQKVTIFVAIGLVLVAAYVLWPTDEEPTGAPLAEVAVPDTLSAVAVEGKGIFDTKCAACHGPDAAGRDGAGPPLVHVIYEPGHHGDRAFLAAATAGVRQHHWPFGNMLPVDGITPEEVAKIVVYVRELQRANGIE